MLSEPVEELLLVICSVAKIRTFYSSKKGL